MPVQLPVFYNHSRHTLEVRDLEPSIDVLAFDGDEALSQPFRYRIEFTSLAQDIAPEQVLGRDASFSLHPPPLPMPAFAFSDMPALPAVALRTLYGVITGFRRLASSRDEAVYEVTLEPRLALLSRGKQQRIHLHRSVPEIVEAVLRSRHGWRGQDFHFDLVREYPRRRQVMQYDESDLAFVARLLAEVGIWYRFSHDDRLRIDVVTFHDDQRRYQFGVTLPLIPPSGLGNTGQDHVWDLQTQHQVVEKHVNIRAYDPLQARLPLQGEVDQTQGDTTTYGEAYHYAEPYTELGDRYAQDEHLQSESGFFHARLRHERYLNARVRLSGASSSAALAPGQVLEIDGAPKAFAPGALITHLRTCAARDRSLTVGFEGMPFHERICFRPPLPPKPRMAGSIPARITSTLRDTTYASLDPQGYYTVRFLFDRDTWPQGGESKLLRLARAYAGDTYGLHFPLLPGTEVAVAFEHGDPDRPYIAHALHDSEHPDPVAIGNDHRNVLRTPANNKLRLEDSRGQEHIKLSTEHSGKSQLNLGHLVDAERQRRGEGFELRTDGHGALRAGSGLFISADTQAKAAGPQLEMAPAMNRLKQAAEQSRSMSADAAAANADPAAVHEQFALMREELDQLRASVALLSAPQGIALTSGKHLQLAAQDNLFVNAGGQADISVMKRLFMGIGQGLSVFANKLGIKLIANQGPVTVQAQNDSLQLLARNGLEITSSEDEIRITAKKRIVLNAGGSYISIDRCCTEIGTEGDVNIRAPYFDYFKTGAVQAPQIPPVPAAIDPPRTFAQQYHLFHPCGKQVMPHVPYTITAANGEQWKGYSDSHGFTERVWTAQPEKLSLVYDYAEEEEEEEELPEGITLRLGLFFDGTGNNAANSAATESCRREDVAAFGELELKEMIEHCKRYGFGDFGENGFSVTPGSSYGNAPSNVVRLHDLYPDHATDGVPPGTDIGYVPVYMEGIGTSSHGGDKTLSLALGLGDRGVIARVEQAPGAIEAQLKFFLQTNPGTVVRRVEFDIFGFSRGAAAARHCANELLKPDLGLFKGLLSSGRFGLVPDLDLKQDVCINLIGLFDTVAAILNWQQGDFSAADERNPGVNLYLPPGCARRVIHLTARDEWRESFALNSVQPGYGDISLPGAHSDLGGGYAPRAVDSLLLTQLQRVSLRQHLGLESDQRWVRLCKQAELLKASGLAGEGSVEAVSWEIFQPPRGKYESDRREYHIAIVLKRVVRGEYSLVSLRVMRELAVKGGVPFDVIDDEDSRFKLPDDLQAISARILDQVMSGNEVNLDPEQERLLLGKYIHQSAHWGTIFGVLANKPARENVRNVYPNTPQKGYPE
jgi:type VI secretion system secreted protein VgrG